MKEVAAVAHGKEEERKWIKENANGDGVTKSLL